MVSVTADASTHTLPFEVRLANPDLSLRPEMVVDVELFADERRPALSLPLSSVVRDASLRSICFVAQPGESPGSWVARRRELRLGKIHGNRVIVSAGLEAGERVVTRGQHFVADGYEIKLVPQRGLDVAAGPEDAQ